MQKINILLCSDKNYINHLEITLKSLLAHNSHLQVFILHTGDIPQSWANGLEIIFAKRASSIFLAKIDKTALEEFDKSNYISQTTYLRYYIEYLFQYSDSPYWIYLDCDTLINGNIALPFYENDETSLMAISDPYVNNLPNYYFKNNDYFNAGVMYINANYWNNICQALTLHTINLKQIIKFGDQDILNYFWKDNWDKLEDKYNFQTNHIIDYENKNQFICPTIIHFTGPTKPLSSFDFQKSNSRNIKSIVSLFKFYNDTDWNNIVDLPLGFFTLTLGNKYEAN